MVGRRIQHWAVGARVLTSLCVMLISTMPCLQYSQARIENSSPEYKQHLNINYKQGDSNNFQDFLFNKNVIDGHKFTQDHIIKNRHFRMTSNHTNYGNLKENKAKTQQIMVTNTSDVKSRYSKVPRLMRDLYDSALLAGHVTPYSSDTVRSFLPLGQYNAVARNSQIRYCRRIYGRLLSL